MLEKLVQWDREAFIYLNNMGVDQYDGFWSAITSFSNWTPFFLLLIFLLFFRNHREQGFWMLLAFSSMLTVLTIVIFTTKELVGRLRPNNDETINSLIRIVQQPTDYSFFSGHAASSFSIATLAVLFLRKRFGFIHLIWLYPLLFSFSRIYLGVHYPSDIIVGTLVGMLLAFIFYKLHQKFRAPYIL